MSEQRQGRDESVEEQADRKWTDVLQELRVLQTGTQLIAGFLLTLPFQGRFEELGSGQRALYLGLVAVALVTTALVLTPITVHRRLSGRQVKGRIVETGETFLLAAVGGVATLMLGICALVFWFVLGPGWAVGSAAVLAMLLAVLLLVLPRRLR